MPVFNETITTGEKGVREKAATGEWVSQDAFAEYLARQIEFDQLVEREQEKEASRNGALNGPRPNGNGDDKM